MLGQHHAFVELTPSKTGPCKMCLVGDSLSHVVEVLEYKGHFVSQHRRTSNVEDVDTLLVDGKPAFDFKRESGTTRMLLDGVLVKEYRDRGALIFVEMNHIASNYFICGYIKGGDSHDKQEFQIMFLDDEGKLRLDEPHEVAEGYKLSTFNYLVERDGRVYLCDFRAEGDIFIPMHNDMLRDMQEGGRFLASLQEEEKRTLGRFKVVREEE